MRVLGVDPGLTRCGLGVVAGSPGARLSLVSVQVVKSSPEQDLTERLRALHEHVVALIAASEPDVLVVERVFSQHNVQSVMGTAQAGAVAVLAAAQAGIPVRWHTPTEVKAAVTGTGSATKAQVAGMVVRILALPEAPRPVDATDALALAICHIWRGQAQERIALAASRAPASRIPSRPPAPAVGSAARTRAGRRVVR